MTLNNENDIKKNFEDALSYPILTEEVGGYPGASGPAAPTVPGTTPLGAIVQGALREVLGWRPNANDPKRFVAALDQVFALREVEGHTEWEWQPRSYTIQADMGAITGAEASIYARAKSALDQCLPLLAGLHPLRSYSDEEDDEATRAIVRSRAVRACQ